MNKYFEYYIDNKPYKLNVEGDYLKSKNKILISSEKNLIKKLRWNNDGYTKKKILSKKNLTYIRGSIKYFLTKKLISSFPNKDFKQFKLSKYHKFLNEKEHYKFLKLIEHGIRFDEVKFEKKILEKAISRLLKIDVTTKNKNSKKINDKTFALRIIRPGKNDFNPPHKDVYLKRLKNAVNIYIPLVGSNKLSSLPLLPKSHYMNEKNIIRTKNGAIVNKVKFRVPCIVSTKQGLKLIRPNPKQDEILVFSPYLIHGGGSNDNKDATRISLELRFWKK